MNAPAPPVAAAPADPAWPAALAWGAAWAAMFALDGVLDLANQALLLVLGGALAAPWLPGWASAAASVAAVAGFNWAFVPPRHSFTVDLHQHALLLATLLVVNGVVAALLQRQRRLAAAARREAAAEGRLRQFGDALRDAADPAPLAAPLQALLAREAGCEVALAIDGDDPSAVALGEADADQRAGLALCRREARPLGPGTGRYEQQPDAYLPLRGRGAAFGAAVLRGFGTRPPAGDPRPHLQALCDQFGLALQRAAAEAQARAASEQAREQGLREAMLAAVSHDLRTPLATIMGAASSLAEQGERLAPAQRQRLATGIVDEVGRISRLTDNTLQLVRLGVPGVALQCDWESAEELVGAVLRRARRRADGERLRARLVPALPLLWCDAARVAQLLDNLVDNALKYSPAAQPVELLVRATTAQVMFAVRDRGPGVAPALRERIFEVYRRGAQGDGAAAAAGGSGVGLAVSRAIAQAHGGELRLRPRGHGGASFEFLLPRREPPAVP